MGFLKLLKTGQNAPSERKDGEILEGLRQEKLQTTIIRSDTKAYRSDLRIHVSRDIGALSALREKEDINACSDQQVKC